MLLLYNYLSFLKIGIYKDFFLKLTKNLQKTEEQWLFFYNIVIEL